MANVVRGMDQAMKSMDLEKVREGSGRKIPAVTQGSKKKEKEFADQGFN